MSEILPTIEPKQVRRIRGTRARNTASLVVMIVVGITFLLPFFWMVSTSVKIKADIFCVPPKWIPSQLRFQNYTDALGYFPFLRYFLNTVTITVFSTLGWLLSSALVAYGFARLRFPGRNVLFYVLLSTMMLPAQVTMVPLFVIFRTLGWVDTFYPLIVPAYFGSPFFIFLLRQYFLGIPQELIDAARIDGSSELGIFSRVILPLSKPALTAVAIFGLMYGWNDFLGPLIYLNSEKSKTVALGLDAFRTFYGTDWQGLMSISTLMVIPMVVIFFFAQKYFVRGIALTGMKG
jgi:multiple sugar transport system permease protein